VFGLLFGRQLEHLLHAVEPADKPWPRNWNIYVNVTE
jgi:hypothetical protein